MNIFLFLCTVYYKDCTSSSILCIRYHTALHNEDKSLPDSALQTPEPSANLKTPGTQHLSVFSIVVLVFMNAFQGIFFNHWISLSFHHLLCSLSNYSTDFSWFLSVKIEDIWCCSNQHWVWQIMKSNNVC